ncbi:hypothetical protein BH11PAT1_BH11PAT1_2570 [soil metagenome]
MNPYLVASESPQDLPILVIDKAGIIGQALTDKLCQEFLTIFVHGSLRSSGNNIIHVPYKHKLPNIPDDFFSYIFTISESEKDILAQVKAFSNKAKQMNAPLIVIIPSVIASEKLLHALHGLYALSTVLVYGDIFGASQPLSLVDDYLQEAQATGKVTISRTGSEYSYPILLDDVIAGVLRVVFSQQHQGETFLLSPTYYISDISLVRMMQNELSDMHVLTIKKTRKHVPYYLPHHAIAVYPNYDIEERIKYALQHIPQRELARRLPSYTPSSLARMKDATRAAFIFVALGLMAIFFLGGIGILGARSLGMPSVRAMPSANRFPPFVTWGVLLTKQAVLDISPLAHMVGLGQPLDAYTERLTTTASLVSLSLAMQELMDVFAPSAPLSQAALLELPVRIKKAYTEYALLQAKGKIPNSLAQSFSKNMEVITMGLPLSDLLPGLLGAQGAKTYLVLVQDNMELRGGGGVITSYGLLTLEKGKPSTFLLHAVSELDSSMKDAVPSPEMFTQYMGTSQLLLKDSNYAVDFPQAMKQVNLQYYLESKQRVDGIIAIDTTFLSELLGWEGANVLQKGNSVMELSSSLEKKLKTSAHKDPVALSQFFSRMFGQRHLQVYSEDPSIENAFLVSNLSGTISEKRAKTEGIYNDFVSVNETNLGQNKTNYYRKRSYEQKITISEAGDEEVMLSIDYSNASKNDSRFGGMYKGYSQVIAPKDAQLVSISLAGERQTIIAPGAKAVVAKRKKEKVAPSLTVTQAVIGERTVYSFPITIPDGQSQNVSVTYMVPKVVNMAGNSFVYQYLFAKQPGVLADPLNVVIDYPSSLVVTSLPSGAVNQDSQILFSGSLLTDPQFPISFTRK